MRQEAWGKVGRLHVKQGQAALLNEPGKVAYPLCPPRQLPSIIFSGVLALAIQPFKRIEIEHPVKAEPFHSIAPGIWNLGDDRVM